MLASINSFVVHPSRQRIVTVEAALRRVQESERITLAMRAAESLSAEAMRSEQPASDARRLAVAIDGDDPVVAIAAVHAMSGVGDPFADHVLLDLVNLGEAPLAGHAAWAFAARRPDARAVPALVDAAHRGDLHAMLAERTLIEWAKASPGMTLTTPLLSMRPRSNSAQLSAVAARAHLSERSLGEGVVVVQPFLHARLDTSGSSLGAGDGGGIASLLRSLGNSLAQHDGIAEVITITRAEPHSNGGHAALSGHLAKGHRIERVRYGTAATVPWREAWQYRLLLEQELETIGSALQGRHAVWHLRMADVGTLAASAVARRLGQPVVFTAAPDPHVVIDALEADGRLDRARFGVEDAANHYWFRARMVERLSTQVDHLALLPRPTLHRELIDLVGLDADDLRERSDVVAEGVDVDAIDAALGRFAASPAGFIGECAESDSTAVAAVLDSLPEHRRRLPWLLTVGRLNSMKGPHRIVAAVAQRPELIEAYNVVIVGGDLADPSSDERSALDLIRRVGDPLPAGAVTVVGHRPPADICDLLVHAAETASIYVCASDKEEFGLAIVEALAAGMVVIAPERGGPRTYVTHGRNGLLCNTSSITSLADAIAQARPMAPDRARIVTSRAHVRADLSISTMAGKLASVYASLLPVGVGAA